MGWRGMLALLLVGLITSGLAGAAAYFLPVVVAAYAQTGQARTSMPLPLISGSSAPAAPAAGSAFNVLLMGSDDDTKFNNGVYLTQSMILVRINPAARHVTMMSIPRDLYAPWSTGGYGKIDEVHQYGDAASVATVERDFNVSVDEWAWVGLAGLIKLIDLMGGVDLATGNPVLDDFYPADIDNANPYSYKRVAVLPGPQHLDGIHALEYVRSRHGDIQEDFGRSQRQQQVLLALRAKARNIKAVDLPSIVASFNGEFKTSFNLTDLGRLRSLISLASQISDPSQIEQIVLVPPYTGTDVIGGADVVTPNWNLIRQLVQAKFT